jgi:hypothetical protein
MRSWELDWLIGWSAATTIILGVVCAVYFGVQDTNQKYYDSMDKCITAGGSFIPQGRGDAICMMGVKQ